MSFLIIGKLFNKFQQVYNLSLLDYKYTIIQIYMQNFRNELSL